MAPLCVVRLASVLLPSLAQHCATRDHIIQQNGIMSEKAQVMQAMPQPLVILHFNDVYNIDEQQKEPVGGAARFASMIKSLNDPLVLFSGDAFNPSTLSTVTKGKQMPPILNAFGVKVACIGNHDFDHGLEPLAGLLESCDFPWLLSNVFDADTGLPLGGAMETHVLDWQGRRIGLMGLVEPDWMATLAAIEEDAIKYVDFVEQGTRLAEELRGKGCDFIIALTHMRVPNDLLLAENVRGVDLILGGHDHDYSVRRHGPGGVWVVKSGTDFREATELTIHFGAEAEERLAADPECGAAERTGGFHVAPRRVEVTKAYPEDAEVAGIVKEFGSALGQQLDKVIAYSLVDLDVRFASIRTKETNVGNFIADVMRAVTNADVAVLNSGTLRADAVVQTGPLRLRDLVAILPMTDEVVVLELTGEQLLEVLNNGVSKYPKLEGRFPCVSGVEFSYRPSRAEYDRILPETVLVDGRPLQSTDTYKVTTKGYLAQGKDGFTAFTRGRVVADAEHFPPLQTMVRRYLYMHGLASGTRKRLKRGMSVACMAKVARIAAQSAREQLQLDPDPCIGVGTGPEHHESPRDSDRSASPPGRSPREHVSFASPGHLSEPACASPAASSPAQTGSPVSEARSLSPGRVAPLRRTVTEMPKGARPVLRRTLTANPHKDGQAPSSISPMIDGRIICVDD